MLDTSCERLALFPRLSLVSPLEKVRHRLKVRAQIRHAREVVQQAQVRRRYDDHQCNEEDQYVSVLKRHVNFGVVGEEVPHLTYHEDHETDKAHHR